MDPVKKLMTLVLVSRGGEVLLGMKKRGFGEGRWNGFGGKVHEGEAIEEAARRELDEEAGIAASALTNRGTLTFGFEGDPVSLEVHLFSAGDFSGEPRETEEMRPQWFRAGDLPFDSMWPDDRHWMPVFFANPGKRLKGEFLFKDANTLLKHSVSVLQ